MRLLAFVVWTAATSLLWAADTLPEFDFTRAESCREWGTPHHLSRMQATAEGLEVSIAGEDPYFFGPARDYPPAKPLWLTLRIKSDEGGPGQVFYFRDQAREEDSARFHVEPGQWREVRLGLPALGPGYRLRIDPPGQAGKTVIAWVRFASAASLAAPQWPKPVPLDFSKAASLRSGALEVQVVPAGFQLKVDGQTAAVSHSRPLIGCVVNEALSWLDPNAEGGARARMTVREDRIEVNSTVRDAADATWQFNQVFATAAQGDAIEVETAVKTDRDRQVAFLPMMLLVVPDGQPTPSKQQALFAGLEYLENEPSSSEADLIGPESKRQVPANHKITFPLMTVLREGRYAGLIWDHAPRFSALFDTPDRLLGTGGHLMGVLFPGCDSYNRREGSLMPTRPETLRAGESLKLRSILIGGRGQSVVPALRQYVKLRGLPPITPNGSSLADYTTLAARGWLDSKIRETDLFRHAVWQGFGAQPAADAALYMDWLAAHASDPEQRRRLEDAARTALTRVPPGQLNQSSVSHVRYPLASLVYGHVEENAAAAEAQARAALRRFAPDGSIPYGRPAGQTDYGRTHFAPDANGLTAPVVEHLLESAAFAGDQGLIAQGLEKLRALNKFRNTVPRGAQTWEVPLHTPDILASAHLVRAYTLGYELSGQREFLDEALYWAWTGVPFVYLIAPVGFPDRPYGTIAVYGATGWRAPVWFGRPVQWCGLVYADALYRLHRHDPTGPWKQLADGIASVGVFYSWPAEDKNRQGLLPDVWEMLAQRRDGPAINPGTVQANAARFYGQGSLYDSTVFREGARAITVHAPGDMQPLERGRGRIGFKIHAWPQQPYQVLVSGLENAPRLTLDGQGTPLASPHRFLEKEGRLILRLSGQPTVELHLESL